MGIAKLKNLAKSQMKGKTSILIFSNLIFSILTMIIPIIQLISNNELNSITKFIIMTIVQPLFIGIAYIHYNCTIEGCNVGILDLFYGYKVKLFRQGIFILQTYLSQIYYIMACNEKLKGTEVLRDSMLMMRGRLGEYIILTLSFIPWLILDIFTFKLASIWINPYKNQTLANYHHIVKNAYYSDSNKNIIA